jgi:hypothetical protein
MVGRTDARTEKSNLSTSPRSTDVYPETRGGKQRPLGVPTIRDGAVMMAAVLVLDPIFEADLPPLHDVSLHHMIVEGASNRILLRTWDSLSFEVRIQLRLSKGKVDLVAAQEIHW